MTELCRGCGISRQCGYKWWRRAQQAGGHWADRSHRPQTATAWAQRWQPRVWALRRRYRFAGAAQLRWYLQRAYPLGPWPGSRTLGRWLQAAGWTRQRRRRAAAGPGLTVVEPVPREPNDVWTADFKGWFRTRDGTRVRALTVRDLATRYVLLTAHLARTDEPAVTTVMRRLFARYGLPRAIRVDNGPPFGGGGPRGWSKLAVRWVCLGIEVLYGRPACPQDNAAHEQMHQVLDQQTATPAAANLAAQQRRFDRWRRRYNHDRPNRALSMQLPAALYRRSERRPTPRTWTYPAHWLQKRTDPRGRIRWHARARLIGEAFACRVVALRPVRAGVVEVYFGPHLLGQLHAADTTAIRAVRIRRCSRHAAASPRTPA